AKARPRDVAALRSLAAVRLVEGDIYRGKRDRPATQRFYQRGADAANQAAAAAPSDAEVLYVAGSAWLRLGDVQLDWPELGKAREPFARSLEIYRRAEA